MEQEIQKQQEALAEAQAKALALRTASHSPASLLGIVKALDRATQAILLLASIVNNWSAEEYNRHN